MFIGPITKALLDQLKHPERWYTDDYSLILGRQYPTFRVQISLGMMFLRFSEGDNFFTFNIIEKLVLWRACKKVMKCINARRKQDCANRINDYTE